MTEEKEDAKILTPLRPHGKEPLAQAGAEIRYTGRGCARCALV